MKLLVLILFLLTFINSKPYYPKEFSVLNGKLVGTLKYVKELKYKLNNIITLNSGSIVAYESDHKALEIFVFHLNVQKVNKKNVCNRFFKMIVDNIQMKLKPKQLKQFKELIEKMLKVLIDMKKGEQIIWYTYGLSLYQEQTTKGGRTHIVTEKECEFCSAIFDNSMEHFITK